VIRHSQAAPDIDRDLDAMETAPHRVTLKHETIEGGYPSRDIRRW
jgi:hypothetical protein